MEHFQNLEVRSTKLSSMNEYKSQKSTTTSRLKGKRLTNTYTEGDTMI